MHASFKELISIRDGEPAAADVAAHVAGCGHCTAALEHASRLQAAMRRLPPYQPPRHGWLAVACRVQAKDAVSRRPSRVMVMRAAAAAALAIVVLSVLLGPALHARLAASLSPADVQNAEAVGQLVARSQGLEALLRGLPRPVVERAATSAAIDELQARIQLLDAQLSSEQESGLNHAQARRLWSERVHLLDSLVSVRYAEQAARGAYWPTAATGENL